MTTEDDTWAQTLITITPEEDGTLREISEKAVLSAQSDTLLNLNTENVVFRRPLNNQQFVEPEIPKEEEEKETIKDVETQTYLLGIPTVDVSVEYVEEASQTVYMTAPCPPLKYFKDIMTSMNSGPLPTLKSSAVTRTIITFHPDASQNMVTEQLISGITDEERERISCNITEEEEAEVEVSDILNFLLIRSFWIIDPSRPSTETDEKEIQTSMIFNYHRNVLVLDNETQTDLTCEPKKSNTTLLLNYQNTKDLIVNCLEDCFDKGIEPRVTVEDIINNIVDRCADRIKYPMMGQTTQTVVSYKLHEQKEEDILRKLKLEVVVDPLESSIIVVPLVDDLLQIVCQNISVNARCIVKKILETIFQRTMSVIDKLVEIRKPSEPKSIEQMFNERKKKIMKLLLEKATVTVSTQTGIAGVPEVMRIKEPKETVCSVCRKHSLCRYCFENDDTKIPAQEAKVLCTQDILLAYKPCYIVTTSSEQDKILKFKHTSLLERKLEKQSKTPVLTSEESSETSNEISNVLLEPEKKFEEPDSVTGWSCVIDTALMKPWSNRESTSDKCKTSEKISKSSWKTDTKFDSGLVSKETEALQILKNTFCTLETCTTSTLDTPIHSDDENANTCIISNHSISLNSNSLPINKVIPRECIFCTRQSCEAFIKPCSISNQRHFCQNRFNTNYHPRTCVKSRDNSFKVIPVYLSSTSDS